MKIYFKGGFLYRKSIKKALETALNTLGQHSEQLEMAISFVDDATIKTLNLQKRNVDGITDVLSFPAIEASRSVIDLSNFPLDVNPEDGRLFLGDVVICTKRAKQQAEEYCHSVKREVCFLATHGLLHLLGYDHVEPNDEEQMVTLQKQILEKAGITRD